MTHHIAKCLALLLVLLPGLLRAQVTAVEYFGAVPAMQPANGLGFSMDNAEWEYRLAPEYGITWGRFDCPWTAVEIQRPDNTSGGYHLPAECANRILWGKMYGVHPSMNALYGPPYHAVATTRVATPVSAGSFVIPVNVASGNLGLIVKGQTMLSAQDGFMTSRHSYAGSAIASYDAARGTITLTAPVTRSIAAGTQLTVNLLLYPWVLNTTDYLTNSSIQHYANYADFLRRQIVAAGLSGEVGIWNEPNWPDESWDNGRQYYAKELEGLHNLAGLEIEIPLYLATLRPMQGVTFVNNYTNVTGEGDIFTKSSLMKNIANAQQTVTHQALHPYGNNPEAGMWLNSCLAKHFQPNTWAAVETACTPIGGNRTSNAFQPRVSAFIPENHGAVGVSITETGTQRFPGESESVITRFDLRQFLGYQAMDVSPIMFYCFACGQGLDWFDAGTQKPYPLALAFKALMQDFRSIARPPVAPVNACSVPSVISYSSPSWPLAVAAFYGSSPQYPQANEWLVFYWQKTYSKDWKTMPSPRPVPLTINVPVGLRIVSALNTNNRQAVAYTSATGKSTFAVTDDPIEIKLSPLNAQSRGCQ